MSVDWESGLPLEKKTPGSLLVAGSSWADSEREKSANFMMRTVLLYERRFQNMNRLFLEECDLYSNGGYFKIPILEYNAT